MELMRSLKVELGILVPLVGVQFVSHQLNYFKLWERLFIRSGKH